MLPFLSRGEDFQMIDSFFPDESKTQIEVESAIGYRSNVYETNQAVEPSVGDWFWNIRTELSHPLAINSDVSVTFLGHWLQYFNLPQLNDYLFQPGIAWKVFDEDDSSLELSIGGGAFRERIFLQFQNAPDNSVPGLTGSAGWKWTKGLGDENSLIWSGGVNYQYFYNQPQNNLTVSTEAKWVHDFDGKTSLEFGTQWAGQHYHVRPEDSESPGNPAPLTTIEGRGFCRYKVDIGAGFTAEISLNLGGNIDATNGYYDAWAIGGEAALHWECGNWKLGIGAEPEYVWFLNRPADVGTADKKLRTQEYVMECSVEYQLTEQVSLVGRFANHLQITNSDQFSPNATLQSFSDNTISFGVSLSY